MTPEQEETELLEAIDAAVMEHAMDARQAAFLGGLVIDYFEDLKTT